MRRLDYQEIHSRPKSPEKHARDIRKTVDRCLGHQPEVQNVPEYRFSVVVAASPGTHEEILNATDALGNAGCTDASIRGHTEGMELLFERTADSLETAIASAISDVEGSGYRVSRVELERDAVLQTV